MQRQVKNIYHMMLSKSILSRKVTPTIAGYEIDFDMYMIMTSGKQRVDSPTWYLRIDGKEIKFHIKALR